MLAHGVHQCSGAFSAAAFDLGSGFGGPALRDRFTGKVNDRSAAGKRVGREFAAQRDGAHLVPEALEFGDQRAADKSGSSGDADGEFDAFVDRAQRRDPVSCDSR